MCHLKCAFVLVLKFTLKYIIKCTDGGVQRPRSAVCYSHSLSFSFAQLSESTLSPVLHLPPAFLPFFRAALGIVQSFIHTARISSPYWARSNVAGVQYAHLRDVTTSPNTQSWLWRFGCTYMLPSVLLLQVALGIAALQNTR